MSTIERAEAIAKYCQTNDSETYLGYFAAVDLVHWIKHELGHPEILDHFIEIHPDQLSKALPNGPILHILSGNSPHAGLQSLLRALLIGAESIVKLPSSGSEVIESWIHGLPAELASLVNLTRSTDELSDEVFHSCRTIIAIGSDQTMQSIQARIQPHQRFIPHGHKLSIGLIDKPSQTAAELAAQDICAFDQQGCLSLHSIYVRENAADFASLLADAMQSYQLAHPRGQLSISESGAISNLRETLRYESANSPHSPPHISLYESQGNTDWTVIYKNSPTLTPSPLNRVASVQPWPADISDLGSEAHYLSTLAIHPPVGQISSLADSLAKIESLDIPRICPLGASQQPTLFWHHDGTSPLKSLIRWRDIQL